MKQIGQLTCSLWLLTTVAVLMLIAGCGSEAPEPTPTPLSPQAQLETAVARLQTLPGFAFEIERNGAPAYVDPDGLIDFRKATGHFVAPNRARATVTVAAPGLITEVAVISIGAEQWQTNIVTGGWEQLPPNWGFNPAALFAEDSGLPAILLRDLGEVTVADNAEAGPETVVLSGTAVADNLFILTGGLIGPAPVAVEIWLAADSGAISRFIVSEPPGADGLPTIWRVDLSALGETVEIEPPQ